MNHRLRPLSDPKGATGVRHLSPLVPLALAAAVVFPTTAQAQEPIPAVLPEVIFLVEESDRMGDPWVGDGTLTAPLTRWEYVRDAIQQVVLNTPLGMNFGVVMSANGTGTEPNGFEQVAYPGMSDAAIVAALNAYTFTGGASQQLAESYTALMDHYLEAPSGSPRSWTTGPFAYDCSTALVIIIGTDVGIDDTDPDFAYLNSTPVNDVGCNNASGFQECWLDNVADYAYSNFSVPPATSGSVVTSTIVVDSLTTSSDGLALFYETAERGTGQAHTAPLPGGIASDIWASLTDAYQGEYSNAAVSMTPGGDYLFASYFEVAGGHPLYRGRLLAWEIDTDPNSVTYGEVIPGGDTNGSFWDAGRILASRNEFSNESNQGSFDPGDQRNGYTAFASMTFNSAAQPFDSTSVYAGSDLTQLLVEEIPETANPTCVPLDHDYDFDCDSDSDDAQLVVNFLRGDANATYFSTGLLRDPLLWRLGDTGHSKAVAASANIDAVATEDHFIQFRSKIQNLPGMVYIASNAGMIHAFNLNDGVFTGSEFWFYIPRAKLERDPANSFEFEDHRAQDQFLSGQTYVNDGRLTLEYVWLDGHMNGLSGCSGPGFDNGEEDGTIHEAGCEWHRILVWSGGYGARHNYALDVTNPYIPRFLWERVDDSSSASGQGRAVGQPAVAAFWDRSGTDPQRRWIVAWAAGSQAPNPTGPDELVESAIYIHDMVSDTSPSSVPTVYPAHGFAITNPATDVGNLDSDSEEEYASNLTGAFGSVSLIDVDSDGSVDAGYVGDSEGHVFKILLDPADPDSPDTCVFAEPSSSDDSRDIYYSPTAFYSQMGELNLMYGSGSPYDLYEGQTGGVYLRKDPEPYGCVMSEAADCAVSTSGGLFDNQGFYRYAGGTGEKTVGAVIVRFGRAFFATHIPASNLCSMGDSRLYGINVETCGGGLFDDTGDTHSVASNLYTETPGLISEPTFANGQVYALNVDEDGIDADSVIDDFNVTPDNFSEHVYMSFRHVF